MPDQNLKNWHTQLAEELPDLPAGSIEIIKKPLVELKSKLAAGQISAAHLKLKDCFELLLKFQVLLNIVYYIPRGSDAVPYHGLYQKLLSILSFGTWVSLGRDIINHREFLQNSSKHLDALKIILASYEKNKIVTWRNDSFGHGATQSDDRVIEEIKTYTRVLKQLYGQLADYYKFSVSYKTGAVVFIFGNKKINASPYFLYDQNRLIIYDSYDPKKNNAYFLDYHTGSGKVQYKNNQDLFRIYNNVKRHITLHEADFSAEQEFYFRSQREAVDRIISDRRFQEFTFLKNRLDNCFDNMPKGLILLTMEGGMGKTTFTKQMDQLFDGCLTRQTDVFYRAFYCNGIHSYTKNVFYNRLSQELLTTNDTNKLEGNIPVPNIYGDNASLEMAQFINKVFSAYQQRLEIKKLVIFIDGLDEISSPDNFLPLIPKSDQLNDNIYFVITSRHRDELFRPVREALEQISITEEIAVDLDSLEYQDTLRSYVTESIKNPEDIEKVMEASGKKFLGIDLYIKAFSEGIPKELLQNLPASYEERYFYILQLLYGKEYFAEILRIIFYLYSAPFPLTAHRLGQIMDGAEATFKLLCYIQEILPLLNIQREIYGSTISLSNKEINQYLDKAYQKELRSFASAIYDKVPRKISPPPDEEYLASTEDDILTDYTLLLISKNTNQYDLLSFIARNGQEIFSSSAGLLHYCRSQETAPIIWEFMEIFKQYLKIHDNRKPLKEGICPNIFFFSSHFVQQHEIQRVINYLEECIPLIAKTPQLDIACYCNLLTILSRAYHMALNTEAAAKYAEEAERMLAQIKDKGNQKNSKIQLSLTQAVNLKNEGKLKEAEQLLKGLYKEVSNITNETASMSSLGIKEGVYNTYANIIKRQSDPNQLQQAINLLEECHSILCLMAEKYSYDTEWNIAQNYLNIGSAYRFSQQFIKCRDVYLKGIEILENLTARGKRIDDLSTLPMLYSNLAIVYFQNFQTPHSALYYLGKAIDVYEMNLKKNKTIDSRVQVRSYGLAADIYHQLGDYASAEKYSKLAEDLMYR